MKYILVILIFATFGCKRDGTETGNPLENNSDPQVLATETYKIVKASCEKVTSCNSLDEVEDCLQQQTSNSNFGAKLGLPVQNQTLQFWEIVNAELYQEIVPNLTNATLCINDISQLSCADSTVVQAYDPMLTEPYQELAGLLPLSCQSAFSP